VQIKSKKRIIRKFSKICLKSDFILSKKCVSSTTMEFEEETKDEEMNQTVSN
jgi:hypothetical protein